ncbi:hypothetical protein ACFW04_008333 [Cataglyphis niger]
MMDLFVVQTQHEVLHWDGHLQSSTSHAALSEVISYYKGSVILRMLQHAFTEAIFLKHILREMILCVYETALRTAYINEQKWDLLVPTQEKFSAKYSVEQLKSWLNHKHYPIIKVTRKYDELLLTTEIVTIEAVNITKNLSIPLTYTTQIQLNFNKTSPTIWLKQVYQESYDNQSKYTEYIHMMKNRTSNQWIIFNLQQTGYYRVNYDKENWKLISRYLKSEDYINIHVLNRAQIIDDAFHLMLAQQIEPSIFWDIVNYLEQETDYVAWYPMFKALEYMSSIFTIDLIKNIFLKLNIRNILQSVLNKIKYTELHYVAFEEHTKCLRQEAAKWSCLLGSKECLKEARNKLMLNFEYPDTNKVLPWWKEWTYCYGLISVMEHYLDWKNMLFTWMKNNDHKISKFLTCIQNIDIIKAHLQDLKNIIMNSDSKNYTLRLALINDFLTMIAKHIKIDDVREYILNNYKEIIPRKISTVATLTVIINHLYNDQHLTELENFVLDDMKKEKGDLKRKKLHFKYSSKMLSHINKEYEENILKIQEKIKSRRMQIKNQHEFSEAFLQF